MTTRDEYAPIVAALAKRDDETIRQGWLLAALFLERHGHDEAAEALLAEVPARVALQFRGRSVTSGG
jgi:Tfp pilus assembly protein PilN